jgi:Flp pilus assembly pilin Flp
MPATIRAFVKDETASAALSYGLLLALIALSVLVAVQGMGQSLDSTMTTASENVEQAERCVQVGSNCGKKK